MTTRKQMLMEPRVRQGIQSSQSQFCPSSPNEQNESGATKIKPNNTKSIKVQTPTSPLLLLKSNKGNYFPLKKLLLNVKEENLDAKIQFLNPRLKFHETRANVKDKKKFCSIGASSRLGWEQLTQDPYIWEKYENSQNTKNQDETKWNFPKDLHVHDLSAHQTESPPQNLNSIYNRCYDSEPRVLGLSIKKSLTDVQISKNVSLAPLLADTVKSPTEEDTNDLKLEFKQIMAIQSPPKKSILINKNISREAQKKSVTFTSETLFHERNLESKFWMTRNYQHKKPNRDSQKNVENQAEHLKTLTEKSEVISKNVPSKPQKPIGFLRGICRAVAVICGREQLSKSHRRHQCHRHL